MISRRTTTNSSPRVTSSRPTTASPATRDALDGELSDLISRSGPDSTPTSTAWILWGGESGSEGAAGLSELTVPSRTFFFSSLFTFLRFILCSHTPHFLPKHEGFLSRVDWSVFCYYFGPEFSSTIGGRFTLQESAINAVPANVFFEQEASWRVHMKKPPRACLCVRVVCVCVCVYDWKGVEDGRTKGTKEEDKALLLFEAG